MGACSQRQSRNNGTTSPTSSDRRSIVFKTNIHYQSRSDEAILLSRTADRSQLFKASNDCLISILSYLSMENVCQLDIAVTNTAARVSWLSSLQMTNHLMINEYTHSNGSIRWLVGRGVKLESLKVTDGQWFAHRMDCDALLGLDRKSVV